MTQVDSEQKRLGSMARNTLWRVFLGHRSVQLYLALMVISGVSLFWIYGLTINALYGVIAVIIAYPLVEYLLHRLILHARLLYKLPFTAKLWKRIHFDHHQDPDDPDVIFGSVDTLLPAAVLLSAPLGWLVGGGAGTLAGLTMGFLVISVYEYFHCSSHLGAMPKNPYAAMLKRLHMLHHFHNEQGNYGITSPLWDIILGTYYAGPQSVPRSPTVRNLGYTPEEAEKYPWVARATTAKTPRS